jgi:transposase InsO family protein
MFAIMRCFRAIKATYNITFEEVLTDNGAEFGGNSKTDTNVLTNPVKRFFQEMELKHRKIRPYRPQTNGKVERFWRTVEEDFVEGTVFGTQTELEEELFKYMIYYNEYRPHQGINGKKPAELNNELSKKL